jgi:hypothetical protein
VEADRLLQRCRVEGAGQTKHSVFDVLEIITQTGWLARPHPFTRERQRLAPFVSDWVGDLIELSGGVASSWFRATIAFQEHFTGNMMLLRAGI